MICRLKGTLADRAPGRVIVNVNGVGYEVLLPVAVEQALASKPVGDQIDLVTLNYFQIDGNRGLPVLIGFVNEVQKEFFERLLTVPKMGPKAAMAALSLSVSTVAAAIERGDHALLRSLNGIGQQRSRDIVATLQGKVARFALLQDTPVLERRPAAQPDVTQEALQMLIALGHRQSEAQRMITDALAIEPRPADVETLVRAVYRKQQENVKRDA